MKPFFNDLRDPQNTESRVVAHTETSIQFANNTYPVTRSGIPILIQPGGLSDIVDILAHLPKTQDLAYSDTGRLKNYIRRVLLPSLSHDRHFHARYRALNETYKPRNVLVIGAGEKIAYYRAIFPNADVITSDVDLLYNPDIVLDAHHIPFPDNYFDLVIAGQVLEHTIRPWIVAQELQRAAKANGIIHIEVPFVFPIHASPYDFYRFTFSALRSLFAKCNIQKVFVTEGLFSAGAVVMSNALIEVFKAPFIRSMALAAGRLLLFWLKYLDGLVPRTARNAVSLPKGYGVSFQKDSIDRTDVMIMTEVQQFLRHGTVV